MQIFINQSNNRYVSSCMGGEVERERSLEFNWQIHVAELKVQYGSNVVPLGSIKRGTYFHRALLYKVSVLKVLKIVINLIKKIFLQLVLHSSFFLIKYNNAIILTDLLSLIGLVCFSQRSAI